MFGECLFPHIKLRFKTNSAFVNSELIILGISFHMFNLIFSPRIVLININLFKKTNMEAKNININLYCLIYQQYIAKAISIWKATYLQF